VGLLGLAMAKARDAGTLPRMSTEPAKPTFANIRGLLRPLREQERGADADPLNEADSILWELEIIDDRIAANWKLFVDDPIGLPGGLEALLEEARSIPELAPLLHPDAKPRVLQSVIRERNLEKDFRFGRTLDGLSIPELNVIRGIKSRDRVTWRRGQLPSAVALAVPLLLEKEVIRFVGTTVDSDPVYGMDDVRRCCSRPSSQRDARPSFTVVAGQESAPHFECGAYLDAVSLLELFAQLSQ
jgi:hypothetical protein